jgi:hypothetical protein
MCIAGEAVLMAREVQIDFLFLSFHNRTTLTFLVGLEQSLIGSGCWLALIGWALITGCGAFY